MTRWIRTGAVSLLALTLVGTALVAGARSGFPATRPRLLSGAAWLASAQVGQLTLLDGSSVEVAAQVPVAEAGERLDVVQRGATAYAVNRSTGTIRRVDGATFEVTDPAGPLPGAGDGLRAFAGADTLFALDVTRGLLTGADPVTLAPRGRPVPLAARVGADAAVLDDAGRLWVLDAASGDLVWLDHGQRRSRSGAATPGAGLLVVADGAPVVVDTAVGTATVLDPSTGAPRTRVGLPSRDTVAVAGSAHTNRLYVVAARGVLDVCVLSAASCSGAVALDGTDLGTPVESGGRLFVPDYAGGRVFVVDPDSARVLAQPRILPPRTRFQLLARDGVVFFNDPDSAKAGVIRLDGGVREVTKYTPRPSDTPSTVDTPRPTVPKTPPSQTPPPRTNPPPPAKAPNPPPPTKPPVSVRILVSTTAPLVDQDVTIEVTAGGGGPAPTSAQWDFGDGGSASGTRTAHHWSAARTYQVSVRATFPDGRTALASLPITVTRSPVLTVQTPVDGSVTGAGISCPGTCSVTLRPGQRVTLTATPTGNFGLRAWGGACSGTRSTCTLTMNGDKTVSASFARRPVLIVDEPGGGSITGPGINCPGTCSATFNPGQTITLTAVPDGTTLQSWEGDCAGTRRTCRLTMNSDKRVGATFVIADPCPPVCFAPASVRLPLVSSAGAPEDAPGRCPAAGGILRGSEGWEGAPCRSVPEGEPPAWLTGWVPPDG